mmetsp:Transcript_25722/g.55336  ORF Transcript_25722/g.55336 Transcript_25722/m.55336 type:complete len:222 (-) Transcript_25722:1810-2475(-)
MGTGIGTDFGNESIQIFTLGCITFGCWICFTRRTKRAPSSTSGTHHYQYIIDTMSITTWCKQQSRRPHILLAIGTKFLHPIMSHGDQFSFVTYRCQIFLDIRQLHRIGNALNSHFFDNDTIVGTVVGTSLLTKIILVQIDIDTSLIIISPRTLRRSFPNGGIPMQVQVIRQIIIVPSWIELIRTAREQYHIIMFLRSRIRHHAHWINTLQRGRDMIVQYGT